MILLPSRTSWWWSLTSITDDADARHADVFVPTLLSPRDTWKMHFMSCYNMLTNNFTKSVVDDHLLELFPICYPTYIGIYQYQYEPLTTTDTIYSLAYNIWLHFALNKLITPANRSCSILTLMVKCCGRDGLWLNLYTSFLLLDDFL